MSLPLKELIKIGQTQLKEAGVGDADRDARDLYCFLDKIDAVGLMMHWQDTLQDNACEAYFDLVQRRAAGEPMQYITGVQEFMGIPFKVTAQVLIPRQDTETMVEDAIEAIEKGTLRGRPFIKAAAIKEVLDLCTGSGAIGVSIAKMCPKIKVVCSDISSEALKIAEENAQTSGCKSVKFQEGDLFSPFCGKLRKKKFDLIITNPPYIQTDVIPTLQREVKDHEPMSALDGGKDGLYFYRRIAVEAPSHLNKNGVLMMEIGYDQRISVTELLQETAKFSDIICLQDLAGKDRIIAAKLIEK